MTVTQNPAVTEGFEVQGNTQLDMAGEERLYQQLKRFCSPWPSPMT